MNEDIRMLLEAILDYLCTLKLAEVRGGCNNSTRFTQILIDFFTYAMRENMAWKDMFTVDTFREFRKYTGLENTSHAIIGLSQYLHQKGRVEEPLKIPKYQVKLPGIYEQYLLYLEQTKEISHTQVSHVRRVLASFHDYLEKHQLSLSALKIEHLDAFMAEFKVALTTLRTYRYHLRGLLKYLYHERKIIKKDLAPLLVGAPLFDQKKPPRFLRPQEVQQLFSSLKLSTAVDIRTYAMVHLAYTLGLRPIEISRITLDDISFGKGELTIRERKSKNPVTLPLPEQTLKAIAAYVFKARPETEHRHLFLTCSRPHLPVQPGTVVGAIRRAMKEAGLSSSAYWLRHTYAQSLLHIGRSIYEIKEMMGHENIQSTQRYLHIDTERMRKVLFNETL
ncbi:MAG: integrase [Candidatus Aminicenantes bacterium]|nr:MAG: integrase [Candidatus Aminicenantes bacterium]